MTRKLSMVLLLVLMVSVLFVSPVQAAKSYYAERFDVQIDIQENGSAIVTETVEFHFSGDPFTFAFREISADNTDGVTFLDASMDGAALPQGRGSGQVEVEAGDRLKVTWHFPPTSDAARVFTVRYRVEGIIRKDDADVLMWRAIPEEHDYSINKSTILLTYPSELTPLEQPTLDWNYDSTFEAGRVVLTASGLAEDEDLILTARFPLNSLTQSAPQWQVRQERSAAATQRALPFGIGAGILTLILGGLGLLTYARANTRELSISPVVSTASPPSDVSPAIVGKLTGQHHTFMGTIFDLAQRGALEVREENGILGTKNHVLVRKNHTVSLQPHEKGLLDALFKSDESQVNMNEVATRLAMKSNLFDEPLKTELIQRGWLDTERENRRAWLTVAGLLMMILSLIVFIVGIVLGVMNASQGSALLPIIAIVAGLSAGLFILSIPLLIYAGTFSILTPAGEEQAARWKGFAEYIKHVSKGREPVTRPDYFEKYLAYAAVFGLGAGWAKYFQNLGGVPLPIWFHATAGSHGDFGAMVAVMSASDTTGASAGGAGGAGASGGGSSGAG